MFFCSLVRDIYSARGAVLSSNAERFFPVIYGSKLKQNLPLKSSGCSFARNTEQESGSTAS